MWKKLQSYEQMYANVEPRQVNLYCRTNLVNQTNEIIKNLTNYTTIQEKYEITSSKK